MVKKGNYPVIPIYASRPTISPPLLEPIRQLQKGTPLTGCSPPGGWGGEGFLVECEPLRHDPLDGDPSGQHSVVGGILAPSFNNYPSLL